MLELERTVCLGVVMLALASCTSAPGQIELPGTVGESGMGSTTEGSATSDATATATGMADGTGSSGTTDEPATTMPLDDTATTGDPSTSGSTEGEPTTTGEPEDCHPLLVEVLYDPPGMNHQQQWIELYNPCPISITLTGAYSLGWGGGDYTYGGIDLQGSIGSGECFVVGGPTSVGSNGDPAYDQAEDLHEDLQSATGSDADGVALFDVVVASVTAKTRPVDAVIYGEANNNGLLDANGDRPDPHVGDAPQGQSIRRIAETATWIIEPSPAPNDCMPM